MSKRVLEFPWATEDFPVKKNLRKRREYGFPGKWVDVKSLRGALYLDKEKVEFDRELRRLKRNVLRIASRVEKAIHQAIKSLAERDSRIGERVIRRGPQIDKMRIRIEETCLRLLALAGLETPHLRLIMAALKIVNDLEIIGDLAVEIARRAIILSQRPEIKPPVDLPRLAKLVQRILENGLDAFAEMNIALAQKVSKFNQHIRDLNGQFFRSLTSYMIRYPPTIDRAIHLLLIAHHLRRIADHGVNISEAVIHMIEKK